MKKIFFSFFILFFIGISNVSAAGDLVFDELQTRFDPQKPAVNKDTKIYLRVKNTSDEDMKGVIRGFDLTEGKKIEIEQSFTAISGGRADVFMLFTPSKIGVHELSFRIIPWENYPNNDVSNDKIITKIYIDADTDGDGIGDGEDSDDDNDGVQDSDDVFPKNSRESRDSDGDGVGDNEDDDDDNDGVKDADDKFPTNAKESNDTDGDGIGDSEDDDDDNDGLSDSSEKTLGTDPFKADTDGDGALDPDDDYPLDGNFLYDTDKDGIANKKDDDDDNDGYSDEKDMFPLDASEHADNDGDGLGDNIDIDDDNDGLADTAEYEKGSDPKNPDTDNDGVKDGDDVFPLDASETLDSDNDGIGDGKDPNDNNKGPVIILPEHSFEVGRNQLFSLDASSSYDPEEGDLKFIWQLLDKNNEVTQSIEGSKFEAIFPSLGDQKIRLTVLDNKDEPRVVEMVLNIYLSSRDITLGISIVVLLHILGFFIYWLYRKKD